MIDKDAILLSQFEAHRDFTRVFLDAFVLIDNKQNILKFNSAFCQIVELSAVSIKRIKSLKKILSAKISSSKKESPRDAIVHIQKFMEPTRIDEISTTLLASKKKLSLIISSYPYFSDPVVKPRDDKSKKSGNDKPKKPRDDRKLLGLCLLLRDVTAETNLQSKYKDKTLESFTDPLTGLYTRRYFEEQIDKELVKSKTASTDPSFAIIMLDLDKFKAINDNYGHQAGDFILSETAKILKVRMRHSDILGRYGGEELLAVIFAINPRGARIIAEKLRVAVQDHVYLFQGQKLSVTISIGVTFVNTSGDTRRDAIKRADKCLYRAKRKGKNIVICDFEE